MVDTDTELGSAVMKGGRDCANSFGGMKQKKAVKSVRNEKRCHHLF